MLGQKMQDALNEQMTFEFASGYLYLSMSAYFESINLLGFAQWMKAQASEELLHGMKFFDFINERSGRVRLGHLDCPLSDWETPLSVFAQAYEHECEVSRRINKLVDLAREDGDHATDNFLQWFVAEQVEEEASVDEVIQKLKLAGSDGGGLFLLDRDLAARQVVTTPAAP